MGILRRPPSGALRYGENDVVPSSQPKTLNPFLHLDATGEADLIKGPMMNAVNSSEIVTYGSVYPSLKAKILSLFASTDIYGRAKGSPIWRDITPAFSISSAFGHPGHPPWHYVIDSNQARIAILDEDMNLLNGNFIDLATIRDGNTNAFFNAVAWWFTEWPMGGIAPGASLIPKVIVVRDGKVAIDVFGLQPGGVYNPEVPQMTFYAGYGGGPYPPYEHDGGSVSGAPHLIESLWMCWNTKQIYYLSDLPLNEGWTDPQSPAPLNWSGYAPSPIAYVAYCPEVGYFSRICEGATPVMAAGEDDLIWALDPPNLRIVGVRVSGTINFPIPGDAYSRSTIRKKLVVVRELDLTGYVNSLEWQTSIQGRRGSGPTSEWWYVGNPVHKIRIPDYRVGRTTFDIQSTTIPSANMMRHTPSNWFPTYYPYCNDVELRPKAAYVATANQLQVWKA